MRQHSRRCMTALWLVATPATLLVTDACSPNGGPGQVANPFAQYLPGLRIGPGGRLISNPPSYNTPAQPSAPALPAVYRSLMQLCKEHYSLGKDLTDKIQNGRQMDAYPEYETAFAGIPIVPEFQNGHSTGSAAENYAECLADARGELGDNYFFGNGVAQDYAEAARWYEKSLNTKMPPEGGSTSEPRWQMQLGVLYAYGLGVPKDLQRARQLWSGHANSSQAYPKGSTLTRLMNYNALPKTMDDWKSFQEEVKIVDAKIEEKEAREQAIAEQKREREEAAATAKYNREHPETARSSDQGDGSGYSHRKSNCTFGDYMFAPRNSLGGIYLGGGC